MFPSHAPDHHLCLSRQGLESLRKLTDLSLYHNRIHDVQGAAGRPALVSSPPFEANPNSNPHIHAGLAQAACRGLQYLSLGRNRLGLSQPSFLLRILATRFPSLEALVLQGQTVREPGRPRTGGRVDSHATPLPLPYLWQPQALEAPSPIKAAAVAAALPRLQYLDHQRIKPPVMPGSYGGDSAEDAVDPPTGSPPGKADESGSGVVGA